MRILSIMICLILLPLFDLHAAVRIAIDNNPPVESIDDSGQAVGFFPELFNQLAKENNWEIEYVPCSWAQCMELLNDHQVDVLPAIAYTKERANFYNFSAEPVFSTWGQLFHHKDTAIDSILDLQDKTVAVLDGDIYFTGDQGLRQLVGNFGISVTFLPVDSYAETLKAVAANKADAALVGQFFGLKYAADYNFVPSSVLVNPIQVRPAFSTRSDPQLLNTFNLSMRKWMDSPDSVYFRLHHQWLHSDPLPVTPLWLKSLMYSLLAVLILSFLTIIYSRRQVRLKTRELVEKNLRLEHELLERQCIEQELSERQQQYQVFFEDSLTIVLLTDPETGQIFDANPAACNFYKYSRKDIKKLKIWDINQADKEQIRTHMGDVKNSRSFHFEFIHKLEDGQLRPVEVFCSAIKIKGKPVLCSIIHDISDRKKAEEQIREKNVFLQAVIDGVSDPLKVIDLNHRVLQMNNAARQQIDPSCTEEEELCQKLFHASQIPCDEDTFCPLAEVKETLKPVVKVHQRDVDNTKRYFELIASPLFDAQGQLYAIVEVARDITERLQIEELLSENEKRLHHLAHHDALTGLPNRLLFEDRLRHAISKARRSHRQIALFFLDLDYFKEVNDNLGHDAGDQLLKNIAKRLRNSVREADTVARMGGDEFLILLEEIDSIELIEATAERISSALNHQLCKEDFCQEISASIGIAIFPEDATTAKELMKAADEAMYRAKKSGKAHFQFYSAPQGRFVF